jgi:hypothetical protein
MQRVKAEAAEEAGLCVIKFFSCQNPGKNGKERRDSLLLL